MSQQCQADFYAARRQEFERHGERIAAQSRLLSNLRGLSFGTAAIAVLVAIFGSQHLTAGVIAALAALAFIVLVPVHARVIEKEEDARRWASVNADAEARCSGRWLELPEDGARYVDPSHPYSEDLDLFGRGSLFQRLCLAHTRFGQDRLARMLDSPTEFDQIAERQNAVRAFAPALELRQRLEAHALAVVERPDRPAAPTPTGKSAALRREPPDPDPFLRWAEGPSALAHRRWLVWSGRLLPVVSVTAILAASLGHLHAIVWAVPLMVQVLINWGVRVEVGTVFQAVSATQGAFLRYGAMLEVLEGIELDSLLLRSVRANSASKGTLPSRAMRHFRRTVGWFDLRHNGLVHPFVDSVLMWDVHCVVALDRWKHRHGRNTRGWFEAIGEAEALSSFAALAHDAPGFCFAEIVVGPPRFSAQALGHPLIADARRVTNDVELSSPGCMLLVTGSNMSGKSTLLRSMGLAAVMGLAGCPVCAERLAMSPLRIGTSMRVRDSLESGVSHFYAELGKLKRVLTLAHAGSDVLFLLDEILHGTNSRERQIGARWLLGELIRHGVIGAVSTHDEALCELSGALKEHVRQVHFREDVSMGKMSFDFLLRPGPVTSGNALRLMRSVGLDVPLE
ncbi:MAG: DNA mismatch repair protein MutS [Polyangiaceae bacterium]|nr:DNA mismatch repair protein MutS [Polyangiaceae bacterium]